MKQRVNDKGVAVPKKCQKCGSLVVVKLRGEPVYMCDKCDEYYGTVPCNVTESFMDEYKSKTVQEETSNPTKYTMRPAKESDLDFVYYSELETVGENKNDPKVQRYIKKDAKESLGHTKIIVVDKTDVGVYQAYATNEWGLQEGKRDWWYLAHIYIKPEYQGRGIGTEIIKNDISGHDKILLQVMKSNPRAKKLYESLGFVVSQENDHGGLVMRLDKSKTVQEGFVDTLFTQRTGFQVPSKLPSYDAQYIQSHANELRAVRKSASNYYITPESIHDTYLFEQFDDLMKNIAYSTDFDRYNELRRFLFSVLGLPENCTVNLEGYWPERGTGCNFKIRGLGNQGKSLAPNDVLYHSSMTTGLTELVPAFMSRKSTTRRGLPGVRTLKIEALFPEPRVYVGLNKCVSRIGGDVIQGSKERVYKILHNPKVVYEDGELSGGAAYYIQSQQPIPVEDVTDEYFAKLKAKQNPQQQQQSQQPKPGVTTTQPQSKPSVTTPQPQQQNQPQPQTTSAAVSTQQPKPSVAPTQPQPKPTQESFMDEYKSEIKPHNETAHINNSQHIDFDEMISVLRKSEYGVAYHGKLITNPTRQDYNEKWHCLSPTEFIDIGGGVCYDFVEWEAAYLMQYGVPFKKFHISHHSEIDKTDPGKDAETHAICVAVINGKYLYIEGSFKKLAEEMGYIREFNSIEDILDFAVKHSVHDASRSKLIIIDYTDVTGLIGCNVFGYQNKIFSDGKIVKSDFVQFDKYRNVDKVMLRPATKNDINFIYDCEIETVESDKRNDDTTKREVLQDSKDSVGHTKIIFVDNNPDKRIGIYQGYATNEYGLKEGTRDWWYLAEIYIIPEFRNKGIGSAIIKAEIEKHDKIMLNVLDENTKAQRLYESLGFKTTQTYEGHKIMRLVKGETYTEDADIGTMLKVALAANAVKNDDINTAATLSKYTAIPFNRASFEQYREGHGQTQMDMSHLVVRDDKMSGMIYVDKSDMVVCFFVMEQRPDGTKIIISMGTGIDMRMQGLVTCMLKVAQTDYHANLFILNKKYAELIKCVLNSGWTVKNQKPNMVLLEGPAQSDVKTEMYTESYMFTESVHENKKLVFHVSPDAHLDGRVFQPRVPSYIGEYDPEDKCFENSTTPRVCFSTSIDGAINAIIVNMNRQHPNQFDRFYVYIPEKPVGDYKHKTNKEIIRDHDVFDANSTKELWIMEPVRLKLYGVIRIDQVKNVKRVKTVPTQSGKTDTRPYYKYKWHWLIKPKVLDKTPYHYDTMAVCERLEMDITRFRYGLLVDGHLKTKSTDADFNKEWTFHSADEVDRAGGGNCFDFVEYEAHYLESYGVSCKKYFFTATTDDNKLLGTHTIVVVPHDGKFVYIEGAFKRVVDDMGNLRTFDKLDDIFEYVAECMADYEHRDINYGVFDYTDETFKEGTPIQNFIDYIITNCDMVHDGHASKPKSNKTKKE